MNLLPLKRHGNEETAVACLTCLCFSLVCPAVSLRWWEHINRKIKEYLCLTVPYSTDALINDAITSSVQLQSHEQLSQLNYQDRCLQVQVRLCTSKKKKEWVYMHGNISAVSLLLTGQFAQLTITASSQNINK